MINMTDRKIVSFQQDAAFLRARGLKQKRGGNPLDALELLRHAADVADGDAAADIWLDMAEVYADMNCHTDSRAMTMMHIFRRALAPDAYYQLAKYNMELGALPEAEKAYEQYLRMVDEGEKADEAREDISDIRMAYGMWKQIDRHTRRKVRRLREVRRRQIDKDFAGADRIFAKELAALPTDSQLRVNRAMNLCLQGDWEAARQEIDIAAKDIADYPAGIIILAAQVYHRLGETPRADQLLSLLDRNQMSVQDLQMLMALMADMQRDEQAYQAGSDALKQRPYDRRMLHLMAVTAARMGREEQVIAGFWQRILRMDPEDDVAQWHLQALRRGELTYDGLFDAYTLPNGERARRGKIVLELLGMPKEAVQAAWQDGDIRRILHWALFSETPALVEPAIRLMELAAGQDAARFLAEFIARTRLDVALKLEAAQAIAAIEGENWPGIAEFMQMQLIPGYQEALDTLPVGHRQMVRMAQEVLEKEYGVKADVALALQCSAHLQACFGGFDRMRDLRCAAAALAFYELRMAGHQPVASDVARKFRCSPRKLEYYAACLNEKE